MPDLFKFFNGLTQKFERYQVAICIFQAAPNMIPTIQSMYNEDPNLFNRFCDFILCNRFQTYTLHLVYNNEDFIGQISLMGKITNGANEKYESFAEWYSAYSGISMSDPEVSNIGVMRNIYITKRVTLFEIINSITLVEAAQFKDIKFYANALFLWIYRFLHNNNLQMEYTRSVEYSLQWNSCSYLICTNKIKLARGTSNPEKADQLLSAFRNNTLYDATLHWKGQTYSIFDKPALESVAVEESNMASTDLSSVDLEALQARLRHLETVGLEKIDAVSAAVRNMAANDMSNLIRQMQGQISSMQSYVARVTDEITPLQTQLTEALDTIASLKAEIAEMKATVQQSDDDKQKQSYTTAVHPVYPTNESVPMPVTWYATSPNGSYHLVPVQPYHYVTV